jgi:hypothetical protein
MRVTECGKEAWNINCEPMEVLAEFKTKSEPSDLGA